MSDRFDVAVAGAGPAGAATAGILARRGLKVLLVDKASFPRDKPCGEGLLPHGVRALRALGISLPEARPLSGLRYWTHRSRAESPFPAPALGVRRLRLDDTLLRWAVGGGARFEERTSVSGPLLERGRTAGLLARSRSGAPARWRAALTVCADGLHSPMRAGLGLALRARGRPRFAWVGRLEGVVGIEDKVEVFLNGGREAYLTPTPEGISAALLFPRGREPGPRTEASFLAALRSMRPLAVRLQDARLAGPVLGWGPFGSWAPRAHGEGFLLLGDSAGSPDPIAGEGMSLALVLALRAAPVLERAAAGGGCARILAPYERMRREAGASAFRLARWLTTAAASPILLERAVANLGRRPELFSRLLDSACGGPPPSWLDAARLVF